MHIRCPHCHNAIEVFEDSSFRDVECPSCGSHFNLVGGDAPTESGPTKPRTLGHFELVEQLGVGHFGAVWKAKDVTLDRFVAVKIPRKEQLDEEDIEKFFREARAAAQLRHPNIVGVHEVGRDGDTIFIASDFVDGATLAEWLGGQPLPAREAAQLCVKIADALHVAHEAGVVHRDLKPQNIMMDLDGEPHIMDFGLAKRDAGEITVTVEGALLGTPAYMPPEQASGKGHEADRRSDVYSLGVILYQMLTGTLPFQGEKRMLLVQIQRDDPPIPRRRNAGIPRDLETICLKCLEKSPEKRYESTGELSDDLGRFLDRRPIKARRIGWVARGWRWAKRNPHVVLLLLVLFCSLVIHAATSTYLAVAATLAAQEAAEERDQAMESLVDSLCTSPADSLSPVLAQLRVNVDEVLPFVKARLRQSASNSADHLRLTIGLVAMDEESEGALLKLIANAPDTESSALLQVVADKGKAIVPEIRQRFESSKDAVEQARLAISALHVGDTSVIKKLLKDHDISHGPNDIFVRTFSNWRGDFARICELVTTIDDTDAQRSLCIGLGYASEGELSGQELVSIRTTLLRLKGETRTAATRAAAEWSLRRWDQGRYRRWDSMQDWHGGRLP